MKRILHRQIASAWQFGAGLIGLLVVIQLTGCVTNHAVVPGGTDEKTLAHLSYAAADHADTKHRRGIAITEVDGKSLGGYWTGPAPSDIYLLPGTHRVRVVYWHEGMIANGLLTFNALPGAEYRVHTKVQGYDLQFWLTNINGDLESTAKWERTR